MTPLQPCPQLMCVYPLHHHGFCIERRHLVHFVRNNDNNLTHAQMGFLTLNSTATLFTSNVRSAIAPLWLSHKKNLHLGHSSGYNDNNFNVCKSQIWTHSPIATLSATSGRLNHHAIVAFTTRDWHLGYLVGYTINNLTFPKVGYKSVILPQPACV